METGTQKSGSGRWRIIALFAAGAIIVASLAAAAAWQNSVSQSREDEAEAHVTRAATLQEAGAEGQTAGELLRAYVEQGDETLIPQIQAHAKTGVDRLTSAVGQGGVAELDQIVVAGTGLVEGAGQVIALRQSGDIAGAAAALETLSLEFESLTQGLEGAVQAELDEAASLQSQSADADDVASWLTFAALAVGAMTVLGVVIAITHAAVRRRVPGTPTPI